MPLRDETVERVLTMWRTRTPPADGVSVIDCCGEKFFSASPATLARLDGVAPTLEGVLSALGDDVAVVWGRYRLAYADDAGIRLAPYDDVASIRDDDPRVARAAARADPEEWRESSSGQPADGRYVLCDGDDIVAMATYGLWENSIAGLGVFTNANARGRGLSTRVASAACADLLDRGQVLQWESRVDNAASARVADKLGFVTLGARDIVRLRAKAE
jgi:RimJ/RimL family protein N-acetyltransferase